MEISRLLVHDDEIPPSTSTPASSRPGPISKTRTAKGKPLIAPKPTPGTKASKSTTKRLSNTSLSDKPTKKRGRWSRDEEEKIIQLRRDRQKWVDISNQMSSRDAPGIHPHENPLEKGVEWSEGGKNKLARVYERFKPEIWSLVAEQMSIPWRTVEAMHWQLGEQEIVRRALLKSLDITNPTDPARPQSALPTSLSPPPLLPAFSNFTTDMPARHKHTLPGSLTDNLSNSAPNPSHIDEKVESHARPHHIASSS